MFVSVGQRAVDRKELWAGKSVCPNCGQESDFHAYREVTIISVFFIPIMSVTSGRSLVCDSCGYFKALKGKEYKELRKKQAAMLDNGTYPSEKIREDCHPDKVRLAWSTFKLILLAIIGFIFTSPLLAVIGTETSLNVLPMMITFLSIAIVSWLPFYFSLRRYLVLLKMMKAYNSLT